MSEARLVELETRLAFAEDAAAQLSDVVARQQREIATLEAALKALIERVNGLAQREPGKLDAADEVPPHY